MAGIGEEGEARVPGQEVRVFPDAKPAEPCSATRTRASGSTGYREECAAV